MRAILLLVDSYKEAIHGKDLGTLAKACNPLRQTHRLHDSRKPIKNQIHQLLNETNRKMKCVYQEVPDSQEGVCF